MSHTLVLDVGKTHAKVILINTKGEVLYRQVQKNGSVPTPDYLALDTAGVENWLLDLLPQLPGRSDIRKIIVTTHGAAFAAIHGTGLALPVMDYEWDGYGAVREQFIAQADAFADTGSPDLPLGLNAGLQLYWLRQQFPQAWKQVQAVLPYAQYWAWWFCEQASTEVSSLGCHTHLWQPIKGQFARWMAQQHMDSLFPPLRKAWEVLGPLRPALARKTGLPADCQVYVGVHDSNACLARHLKVQPNATVVSTGTWCIVMANQASAAAAIQGLHPERDQLVNVSVSGQPVPTSRFMAGREFAYLCAGADPSLATPAALRELLQQGWSAVPAFAESGGPYRGQKGSIQRQGQPVPEGVLAVPLHLRPALASYYCAQVTCDLIQAVNHGDLADRMVIVEGPFADNEAYVSSLQQLLPQCRLVKSADALEGTARGAWMLANWEQQHPQANWYAGLHGGA
ncbi:L-fuculose kinase [Curvibacter sp. CHRR-16]|uniref:FGGY-family carbohydrate kinase n=1 Tax=Curvibacter sp. CHRR-16 TaxID=2835872 RepID=UPI001BD929AF|nr:FGGY family carbohydrate kinase [Curvibacter sp. CHRR-16]MBT0570190.1 L-fuculose kinase [Curvibacter sp. CHRR-16]